LQGISQFARTISGIDVDQDYANSSSGQLYDQPFDIIGRPDTDTVTAPESVSGEPASDLFDL